MHLQEVFRMALSSLGANKLRSGLTMLGITIGVFSVIGVMTAIGAMQNSIESGLSELGSGTFQIQKYPAVSFGGRGRDKYENRPNISYADATTFRKLMDGIAGDDARVGFEAWDGGKTASAKGQKTNPSVQVCGGDKNFFGANAYNIAYGRAITEEDVEVARNAIVIGADIEQKLFANENPLNQPVKVNGKTFTVVGVMASKGTSFGQSRDNLVVIPITEFFEDFGRERRSINVTVQAKSQEVYDAVMDKSIGAMRIARGMQAEDESNFEVYSNDSLISTFNSISGAIKAGAFVISFIALIAAGIGIMNIMLVSVTERTKEIGIRKSIGAKKGNILSQFLIESVFLSEVGGLIGILLGVIGGNVLAISLGTSVVFPWDWALTSVLVCSAIGIGFGLYPAYKAASLDPIEALRFE
ncbi:MAG: ABC transporter permease [Rhizobacter sp.]|nr:ABC transporter permease [Chlorobiales bacterium]